MASVGWYYFTPFVKYLVGESVKIYTWSIPTVKLKGMNKSIVTGIELNVKACSLGLQKFIFIFYNYFVILVL